MCLIRLQNVSRATIVFLFHYKTVHFLQNPHEQKAPHSLHVGSRYGVSFLYMKSGLYSAWGTTVVYGVSCHIAMRYNSSRLYYWLIQVHDVDGAIVDIPYFPGGKRALVHRAPLLIHKPSNNLYRDRLSIFRSLMANVAY